MPENADVTGQPTLEEALAELESLKGQLSGSDLRVFSQNRDLRQENASLRAEVTRLTEECVSQTFVVRKLEKAKVKLEGELNGLASEKEALLKAKAELEDKIAGLDSLTNELGEQLEVHRSQENHLSQELERTIASNRQELARLESEHDKTLSATRQTLEQERQQIEAELKAKLSARAEEVVSLESRIEAFKEEFLSQEFVPAVKPVEAEGQAYRLLCSKLEGLLGFPGRTLVEQVFRHCGATPDCGDPALLEEAFEAIQDTALKLTRGPEQERELAAILSSVWQELELGATLPSTYSTPSTAVEAPAAATLEAGGSSLSQPEVELPPAEGALEDAGGSKEQAAPEPEQPEPGEAQAVEVAGEDVVASLEAEEARSDVELDEADADSLFPDSEPASLEDEQGGNKVETVSELEELLGSNLLEVDVARESAPESEPELEQDGLLEEEVVAAVGVATIEEAGVSSSDDGTSEIETLEAPLSAGVEDSQEQSISPDVGRQESVDEEFERAVGYLQAAKYELALPIFQDLHTRFEEVAYVVGEVASLAGLERYEEAYALDAKLNLASIEKGAKNYRASLEAALVTLAQQTSDPIAKKCYLVELARLIDDQERVLECLDEAEAIAIGTPWDAQLSMLLAKYRLSADDVTEYLLEALAGAADDAELFTLLKENFDRYPELSLLSKFYQHLLDSPRAEALDAEAKAKELLPLDESIEDQIEQLDPVEEVLTQVFLDHLIPRAGVNIDVPSEEFEEILQDAEPAAFVGALRQALRSLDYTMFFDEIEVLSYDGDKHFLLRSSPEPKATLVFGAGVDDATPEELRFLALRELFSMARRHGQLAHMAAQLDDSLRATLLNTFLEVNREASYAEISRDTQARITALEGKASRGGQDEEFRLEVQDLLWILYREISNESVLQLADFFYDGQLNKKWLAPLSDGFAASQTGIVVASYAIARDALDLEDFEALEEQGFSWLYSSENIERFRELRLRLQRLWAVPVKALVGDAEDEA